MKLQIDATKSRVLELIESTLQLSNLDLVASSIFRGEKSATMPATSKIQNDIIGPALTDAQVSYCFLPFRGPVLMMLYICYYAVF